MKKIVVSLSLAATLGLSACSPANEEVLVETKVGNITKDVFYEELKETYGSTVLEQMIEKKLLSSKYDIDETKLQEEVDNLKAQFGSDEEFLSGIQYYYGAKDEESFKDLIRLNMLRFEAATEGIETNDELLKEYYEKNKINYQTVTAQHILVKTEDEAKEIKKQLDKGVDFSELATKHSTDTYSAQQGGSLGEFKKGDMVKEFEDVAFTIEPNTISDIVKSEFGFHIIKVNERKQKDFEVVKDEVKNSYLTDNAKDYNKIIEELKKETNIKIKDEELKKSIASSESK